MTNTNTSSKRAFKYVAPKGMKRVWTISGRWGKGRLLSNEAKQQFVQIHFFRSSVTGERLAQTGHIFTPTSRIDFKKMNCALRPDGSFNVLEAMSKAVNGKRAGLALIAQTPAPATTEAPVAAPVAEATPAPVAA